MSYTYKYSKYDFLMNDSQTQGRKFDNRPKNLYPYRE